MIKIDYWKYISQFCLICWFSFKPRYVFKINRKDMAFFCCQSHWTLNKKIKSNVFENKALELMVCKIYTLKNSSIYVCFLNSQCMERNLFFLKKPYKKSKHAPTFYDEHSFIPVKEIPKMEWILFCSSLTTQNRSHGIFFGQNEVVNTKAHNSRTRWVRVVHTL